MSPTTLQHSDDVIETVTAAAEAHLQTKDRNKLMRDDKTDTVTGEIILGDRVIGILIRCGIALIPIALDPHGRFGPMLENFLFGLRQAKFRDNRVNAAAIHKHISSFPCPVGIIPTATAVWKQNKV